MQPTRSPEISPYPKPTPWTVLALGIWLATPFVIGNFLFSIYLNLSYAHLADVQGMSMVFVVLFIAFVVLSVIALKEFHSRLYMAYNTSRGIFWLSLFLLVPVLWVIRGLIAGTHAQFFAEIITRASIAAGVLVVVATSGVTLLAYMLEKLTKQKPRQN